MLIRQSDDILFQTTNSFSESLQTLSILTNSGTLQDFDYRETGALSLLLKRVLKYADRGPHVVRGSKLLIWHFVLLV